MFTLRVSTELHIDEVKARLRAATLARLNKCGYLVEAEAKRLLSAGKSETRGGIGAKGEAIKIAERAPSAPGDPPHIDTGNLRASIRTAKTPEGTVVVGPSTTAWYGRVHEFGGKHHPKRPFMRPALANCIDKFPALFQHLDLSGADAHD